MADLPRGASQDASEIDAWLASDDDSSALPSMVEPSTPAVPPVDAAPAADPLVEMPSAVVPPSEASAAPPLETNASAEGPAASGAAGAQPSETVAESVPPIAQSAVAEAPGEASAAPAVPEIRRVDAPPPAAPASLLQAVSALDRQSVPKPRRSDTGSAPVAVEADHARYVLFAVAGAQYAVRETYVTELDRVPKITLVPNVPVWVRGVTNRRGDILSVIDARTLLGLDRTDAQNGRMLVVRLLDDTCSLGMLVDDVQQIASVKFRDIRPPNAALEGPLAPFLTGLFDFDQRTVAVLDLDRLLRSPTIRQFDEPSEATVQS